MIDIPEHPDIERTMRTGYPFKDDKRPICTECRNQIHEDWISIAGLIFCKSCILANLRPEEDFDDGYND